MKDLFVRRVYSSYGISVVVELDFVKKTVSLTEKDGSKKLWDFTERTPEYLNGWRAILKAMDYAVEQAKKEMDALEDKEHQEFIEMYAKLDQSLKKGDAKVFNNIVKESEAQNENS